MTHPTDQSSREQEREALQDARYFVELYQRRNPRFEHDGAMQDPSGVNACLERIDAVLGEKPLLLQDENAGREGRRYNEWHASRPDARLNAREAAATLLGLTPTSAPGNGEADTARIDALEACNFPDKWIVAHNTDSFTVYFGMGRHATRKTLREAIDATMLPPAPAQSATTMTTSTTTETCYSTNGEDFNYTELGDALDSLEPGDTVWIGEAQRKSASHYFRVDDVLEQMGERAYDDAGEHADTFPDVTKAEREELAKLISDWLDSKVPVRFWSVCNVREVVVTQAMLDGTEDVEGSAND